MFYLYILQSQLDQSYYIGYTQDLEARITEHNLGSNKYSSKKRPWKLVYSEEFELKSEAIKRERYIKRLKSKKYINNLIEVRARSSMVEQ